MQQQQQLQRQQQQIFISYSAQHLCLKFLSSFILKNCIASISVYNLLLSRVVTSL
jgi:hypothetical protein